MPYAITQDNYFDKSQPAKTEEMANDISVPVLPLKPAAAAEEVFRSESAVSIGGGASVSLSIQYNQPPVIEAVVSLEDAGAGVSVTSATYYAWGVDLIVGNSGGASSFVAVVNGKPLTVQGKTVATAEDADSILEYGRQKYVLADNHLIQTLWMAQKIANDLLISYKEHRTDVSVQWRGNPAMELRDIAIMPEYNKNGISTVANFVMYRHKIMFDGTLKMETDARRTEYITIKDTYVDSYDKWQDTYNTVAEDPATDEDIQDYT